MSVAPGLEGELRLIEENAEDPCADSLVSEPVCSQWQRLVESAICLFLIAVAASALRYLGPPSPGDLTAGLSQLKQYLISLKP
jgi:hypothetical protein